MAREVLGKYAKHTEKLLKDAGFTAELIRDSVEERYGKDFADELLKDVLTEYEKLIPEIPFIKGLKGKALKLFLVIGAQELALYKAMEKHAKSLSEAWEVCHQALRVRISKIAPWKLRLLNRLMFSALAGRMFERRERKQKTSMLGGFEVEYLGGKGRDFDLGVNYHQCSILSFMRSHGGEEFAPYVCMSDIVLSDAVGWGLLRTQTLADGCDYCDFRFRKGASTEISSKTPHVQETIERIQGQKKQ